MSNLFQVFDSNESSVTIKPRCRLIEENNLWFDEELEALAESEEGRLVLAETVARWMTKLPGKVWALELPKVWSADYERPIFNENGERLYRVPSMEDENREREEG